MSGTTPPGWYDDGQGKQRWWDGTQWTAHEQGAPAAQPTQPPPSQPPATSPYGTPPPVEQQYVSYGSPQQGYPQQAYGQPAAQGSKRTGLLIAALAGILILGGVIAAVLLLAGSGGASSDDPSETVQSFIDASADGDCDAALDLLTADLRRTLEGQDCDEQQAAADELGFDPSDFSFDVGKASIAGDTATVPVTLTGPGEIGEFTTDYTCVKEGGNWLISGFGAPDVGVPDVPQLSDFPTTPELPSGFPTEVDPGEVFPSGIPSEFLSEFPEGFPTEFFSEFPEGFPTEFFSEFPEGIPTE